jgi:hypothetical protein
LEIEEDAPIFGLHPGQSFASLRVQVVAPTAATSPTSTPTLATPKKPVIGAPPGEFTFR